MYPEKTVYDAGDAHIAFSENISEARSGILSSETELLRLNALISPLVKNGQSVHQIYASHVNELTCSEKTIYNYIDACLFDVRNIDLPRKVKYRPRYKKPEFKVDKGCRIGRTYDDFQVVMEKNPDLPIVQMDSVIGSRGGKVLLTIHFVETSLMLAFLRDANTSQSVIDIFCDISSTLGRENLTKLFPVILTDNGSEFSNPKAIEYDCDGKLQTRIFYCDPSSPHQKGAIEVNHELIHRILPKGTSFDSLRSRVPYVCNGCEQIGKCSLMKNIYDAEHAHVKAHEAISQSRSGLCVCEEEVARLNAIISPLVKQGQSIHQIYVSHENELMCSEKTIYNYIDACLFDVRNIDLPKKVRFRERYKKPEFKVDKGCRIGRNYEAFQSFMENNPDTAIVQMDSVIGTKGGKCLLTVHFVETSLMLAFLREANTSQSVIDVYNDFDQRLGHGLFQKLFPVILTDNGSEFSNPKAIEYGPERYNSLRTRIYYCDAGCPHQKGAIEVNHGLIRRVLPKGSCFNHLLPADEILLKPALLKK